MTRCHHLSEMQFDCEAFSRWWSNEGSAMWPKPDHDIAEHTMDVARIAWLNGAFIARLNELEAQP